MLSTKNKFQYLLVIALMLAMALGNVAPAAATAAGNLYALGNTTGSGSGVMELYLLDKTNASSTFVVSTGTVGLRGLAIDPTTGKFYSAYGATIVTTKRGIVEIDPVTGAVTDIGGTKAIVSLAFDSSGQLYGAENAGSGTGNVYKISTSNGTETFLGTVTSQGNEFGPGIAYDSNGSALYFKGWPGQLSTLNTTSGVETLVGTVTFPWYASHSFDFDENGNVYYAQHPCNGCGDGLAFASAGNIFSPTNLGFMGIRVWGLSYQINANQPPTASAGGPYDGDEGSPIALSGATASDPDVLDTLTYSWSVDSALCSFNDASLLNPALTCTDNGNYTATLEVSDGVNPPVTSDAVVTVDNVAPIASLGNNGPIDEGGSAMISFSGAFDPSSVDSASLHYAFDCSGGSLAAATYAGSGTSDSTSCAFADNGSYTVSGKIMDKDGGSNEYTTVVTVNNVAPTITLLQPNAVAACGQSNSPIINFDDPALANDTYTAVVDWGDGSSDTYSPVSSGFMPSHVYALAGQYTVSVTVSDEDGGTSAPSSTTLPVFFTIVGGGVQPPLNQDGSSIFKYKSTIPVKIKAADCDGSFLSNLTISIALTQLSGNNPGGAINEPISTSAADTTGFMRFTGSPDNQYIYNLATKPLPDSSATYKITLTILQTGQTVTVNFGLKP